MLKGEGGFRDLVKVIRGIDMRSASSFSVTDKAWIPRTTLTAQFTSHGTGQYVPVG